MKKLNPVRVMSDKCNMVFFGNIAQTPVRRLSVVLPALGVLVLGLLSVSAMPSRALADPTDEAESIDAPLLDTSHARRAYDLVETWLEDSPEVPTRAEPIRVTALTGVKLTLRTHGIVVGEGQAIRPDVAATLGHLGPSVDLVELLKEATDQAKAGVLESLADAQLRAVLEGRNHPEDRKLRVTDVNHRIIAELELAYGLTPLTVPDNAAADAVYARFAPCYHGLGFHDPAGGTWSWVWPGDALSRNIAAPTQLVLGLKALGYDRSAVARLARPKGVELARFETLHMVRPTVESQPVLLVRSGSNLPHYAVGERDLESMCDRMLEHLLNRFTTNDLLHGTYHPTSGRYDPLVATDEQTALVCYAVMRHCGFVARTRPDNASVLSYAHRAGLAMTQLAHLTVRDPDSAEPRVLALLLLGLMEAPSEEADTALRDRVGALLLQKTTTIGTADKPRTDLSDGASALCAFALSTYYDRTRQPEAHDTAVLLLQLAWGSADDPPGFAALPWLAMTQARFGDLVGPPGDADTRRAEEQRRNAFMVQAIDEICRRQVIEPPSLGPDDVLGGFVLSPGPAGSPPNPDWRNAQALLYLSAALRDPEVTGGQDKLGWILTAGLSARFVGQLIMDDTDCYYVRDPLAARGGVRMAPWDNRLAPAPTAMSLIALTELRTTIESMK